VILVLRALGVGDLAIDVEEVLAAAAKVA